MKKILLTAVFAAASLFAANAQETNTLTEEQKAEVETLVQERLDNEKFWKRNSGLRFGYTISQDLENKEGGEKLEAKIGGNFAYVWNITLHKKPIFDRVKFALEFGPSINYVQFDENPAFLGLEGGSNEIDEALEEIELGYHQADIGFKVGASVIVRPFTTQDFRLQGFFHVTPSASVLINDEDVCASFVPFLDYGVEFSWKRIGVGIEMRQGSGKYKMMTDELAEKVGSSIDDAIQDASMGLYNGNDIANKMKASDEKIKLKTKSFRVYLVFKF